MTDEQSKESGLQVFFREFNLPQLIGGPAGKALARLLGQAFEYPGAWAERASESVRDKTRAKTIVSAKLAEAVAARAVQDEALLDRAMDSFLSGELRKQANREAVARSFAEQEAAAPQADEPLQEVDEDWMNIFVRYSEQASSERMQALWGKVLRGELRKSGSFSLVALRFLSELDQQTALEAETVFQSVIGNFVYAKARLDEGRGLELALRMQERGILSDVGGLITPQIILDAQGIGWLAGSHFALQIHGHAGTQKAVDDGIPLSSLGVELKKLLPKSDESALLRQVAEGLDKSALKKIYLGELVWKGGQGSMPRAQQVWPENSVPKVEPISYV